MLPVVAWLKRRWGRRGEQVRLAYRHVFLGLDGHLVMDDLSSVCGEGLTSFTPGDSHETAFKEGRRAAVLHIRSMLGLKAGELLPYIGEAQE